MTNALVVGGTALAAGYLLGRGTSTASDSPVTVNSTLNLGLPAHDVATVDPIIIKNPIAALSAADISAVVTNSPYLRTFVDQWALPAKDYVTVYMRMRKIAVPGTLTTLRAAIVAANAENEIIRVAPYLDSTRNAFTVFEGELSSQVPARLNCSLPVFGADGSVLGTTGVVTSPSVDGTASSGIDPADYAGVNLDDGLICSASLPYAAVSGLVQFRLGYGDDVTAGTMTSAIYVSSMAIVPGWYTASQHQALRARLVNRLT